ncbi:fused toxin protein-like [Drosophila ficusphila]|uniref:fused toxin protein-like n=1 Tax=Drosophila ficusphila TaxID=30025 RepID=UPI0007E6D7D4|nr:fused toxin protein-like [Drosophila ficusphila]
MCYRYSFSFALIAVLLLAAGVLGAPSAIRFVCNVVTQTCEEFVYGGCGGNKNNFLTKDQCELFCLGKSGVSPPKRALVPRLL